LDQYPCDILFVHRDAERAELHERKNEIDRAIDELHLPTPRPYVCVVPVRMMEAWLLFDEPAIREAAGNPNGRSELDMPRLDRLEALPDAKALLHEILRSASGLVGRRGRQFRVRAAVHRLADIIDNFGSLRSLPAFRELERDVGAALRERG
jgi:hypothetical protein